MSHPGLPPTGEQLTITHGTQRLVAVLGGGGIRSYEAGGLHILDGYAEDEPLDAARGGLLQPWPNRVRDGRFSFAGSTHQLAISDPTHGAAIHGFALHTRFEVVERDASSISLRALLLAQQGWPWPLMLHASYHLGGDGLTASLGATNVGRAPAPYGHGVHPYLRLGTPPCDPWTLHVPATTRLVYDERMTPTGEEAVPGTPHDFTVPRPIGPAVLDTCYGGLRAGTAGRVGATLSHPASGVALTLWADAAQHPWLVVFTGDTLGPRARHAVAIEPLTCPPNALATGRDLVILAPGESHSTTWGITPRGLDLG
ncbi:MAG: aldose 1-epimerase family protein [Candidatus Dormibacteria bacterium]